MLCHWSPAPALQASLLKQTCRQYFLALSSLSPCPAHPMSVLALWEILSVFCFCFVLKLTVKESNVIPLWGRGCNAVGRALASHPWFTSQHHVNWAVGAHNREDCASPETGRHSPSDGSQCQGERKAGSCRDNRKHSPCTCRSTWGRAVASPTPCPTSCHSLAVLLKTDFTEPTARCVLEACTLGAGPQLASLLPTTLPSGPFVAVLIMLSTSSLTVHSHVCRQQFPEEPEPVLQLAQHPGSHLPPP